MKCEFSSFASSGPGIIPIHSVPNVDKIRIWHNKELSGGLWCVNRRRCCNKYELLAAIGIRAEDETCSVAQF